MKNKIKSYDHPGRPKYDIKYPTRKEFTRTDICEFNGIDTRKVVNGKVNLNFGKGPKCTLLTITKGMERDMYLHVPGKTPSVSTRTRVNPRSEIVLIRGVTAEPDSEKGLGRRALLYCLRVNKDNIKAPKVKTPKAVKAPKVKTPKVKVPRKVRTPKSTSQTPTADTLDRIHAALATPDPVTAPALTVPAVTIAPEVTPAPAPDPVVEVPAPVETPAPVAEPAPVAS